MTFREIVRGSLGICFLAALGLGPQTAISMSQQADGTEPKLPVIDSHACGSNDRGVPRKAARQVQVYSSWQTKRVLVGVLRHGYPYTVTGAVDLVREPDKAVVLQPLLQATFLHPGDAILGYGYEADGNTAFWAKGVWFKEDAEHVSDKDADCGFSDKTQCTIKITKPGVKEWWIQVERKDGLKGWVLGAKFVGDKSWYSGLMDQMCRD